MRKAVRVLAWRRPVSLPSGEKRFTTPVGLIGLTDGSLVASVEVKDTTIGCKREYVSRGYRTL